MATESCDYAKADTGLRMFDKGDQSGNGTGIVSMAERDCSAADDLGVAVSKQVDEQRNALFLEVLLAPAELREDVGAGGALGGVAASGVAAAEVELGLAAAVVDCSDCVDTGIGFPALAEEAGGEFLGGAGLGGVAGVVGGGHGGRDSPAHGWGRVSRMRKKILGMAVTSTRASMVSTPLAESTMRSSSRTDQSLRSVEALIWTLWPGGRFSSRV